MRIRIFSLLLLLIGTQAMAADVMLQDFEGNYGDWVAEGDAFGSRPAQGSLEGQSDIGGYRGRGFVNTYVGRDAATGTLTSPPFPITRNYVSLLVGGGNRPQVEGVELLVGEEVVRSATGVNSDLLNWHSWDVRDLRGQTARLRIFDRSTEAFGYTLVDHILLTDTPRRGSGKLRLDDYRRSPEYYREPYRPQFHFTPEMNWMNDPNGLVYFEGEYHLFYQHNPHGNSWGHMSWGHAVSTDLVHWEHLPIALHEEYGVMIFSGCCVVDWKNTSGFGKDGNPPLVAVYTGHGLGKQTQDIAYSNDRGRSWTKYSANPVIDLDEQDFRDPKVFWHEPTNKWVMVVSMANAKYIQFYGSRDLKHWSHLSDFGPAGVTDKPNWECPDLFELPIEGSAGETKWVLEVDMGNGSIAGGSGGEYFIGEFDGKQFKCDHDPKASQWVDFGRDFYAPVSYSDIPESDGRRIWIGWMNNWETNQLPTRPWRSAMSIPRVLSLRRNGDGFKLIQTPVAELQSLRGKKISLQDVRVSGTRSLDEGEIRGEQVEIQAVVDLGGCTEFGFNVRVGDDEGTTIGFDVASSRLFVDRTRAGRSDFHPRFAGKHYAPLEASNGQIEMRIFVDSSSVEVFGGSGEAVLTDRIFPDPSSRGITAFAKGGKATIKRLDVWPLKSVWAR